MQAIRIEHIDGHGMFITGLVDEHGQCDFINIRDHVVKYILPKVASRHENFNEPEEDGINIISGIEFCAYKSIEQLNEWIYPDEIKVLFDYGYSVYLLELSSCKTGEHQIVYNKKDIISKTDISSLFK